MDIPDLSALEERPRPRRRGAPPFSVADHLNAFMGEYREIPQELLLKAQAYIGEACAEAWVRSFGPRQEPHIRPSGQKCTRAQALKILLPELCPEPTARGTFMAGFMAEAMTFAVADMIPELDVVAKNLEVEVPTAEGDTISGELDLLLRFEGNYYVVDSKSTTAYGFQKIEGELAYGGDPWGYKRQQKAYMMGKIIDPVTGEQVRPSGAFLVYINKEKWNEWADVFIHSPTPEDIKAWFDHVTTVRECVAAEDPLASLPPRPEWAEYKARPRAKGPSGGTGCLEIASLPCVYCDAVQECWKDVASFERAPTDKKMWRADLP